MAQSRVGWVGTHDLGTFYLAFCNLLRPLEPPLWGRPTVFKTHPGPAGPQAPWMARVMGVGAGSCWVRQAGLGRGELSLEFEATRASSELTSGTS